MSTTWRFLILGLISFIRLIHSADDDFTQSAYVNSELAFTLNPANTKQELLEGDALHSINRDAVVGVVDRHHNFYSLIIVSQFEQLSVKDFARVILDELPIQQKIIHTFEERAFQGNPGVNMSFEGQLQEQRIDYEIDFVYFKNIIYQHVSFMIGQTDRSKIVKLKPKFNLLLDLEPRLKPLKDENLNFGLTWYLDQTDFAHLGYGFKVPAQIKDFRSVWGEEARYFHPDALLGYEANDGHRSIYIIATRDYFDLESFINYWKKSFADSDSLKRIPTKSDDYAILDYDSSEKLLRYQIRFFKGKSSSLAMIQFALPTDNELLPTSLLVGMRWLAGDSYKDALRTLRDPKFSRILLGDQESFYQNTYSHFDLGVRWQLPSNEVVEAGFQQDGHVQADYSLYLENFTKNYYATLQIEQDQFLESLEYHRENLPKSPNVSLEETEEKLGFYLTPFTVKNQEYRYLYISRQSGDLYLRLLIWSRSEIDPNQFINQISISTLKDLDMQSDKVIHHKLGFNFMKPKNYKVKRVTPEEIAPVGEVIQLYDSIREHELYAVKSGLMNAELLLDLYLKQRKTRFDLIIGDSQKLKYLGLDVSEKMFTVSSGKRTKILFQRSLRRGDTFFSSFSLVEPAVQKDALFFEPFKLSFDRSDWIP